MCTVQNSSKRLELLGILFQQLKNMSLVATISLNNMQLDTPAQLILLTQYSATTELRTVSLQGEWTFKFGGGKTGKFINAFDGHRMQQAQHH